jgi:hypothetical protein
VSTNDIDAHDRFRDDLAEYTLGILDGRARSDLLAHVNTCESCANDLAELTTVADALLHVAPGVEPPTGFESRVIERISQSQPAAFEIPRRVRVLVSLAAAVVLLSFGGGWALNHLTSTSPNGIVNSAAGHMEQRSLIANGKTVGLVYAYTGKPSWMFVSVDAASAPNVVRCVVLTKSGMSVDIGTFTLAGGNGAWGTPLPVNFQSVRGIELTSQRGAVIARLSGGSWNPSAGHWS